MSEFLGFAIGGLVTGCVYALIATGLVVTYTTTGIFNFAHGAIAMSAAFVFWQLWQGWDLNVFLALILALLVIAPLFGLIIERGLMRWLYGQPVDVAVVVTVGLLLFLVGLANIAWKPTVGRALPQFFHGNGFFLGGVLVTYHDVATVAALLAAAIGLRVLFTRSRLGIAMRAVVDNPALLAMAGGRPVRVQQLAWVLSCILAAAAGILVASIAQLNILNLTLLVVDGYAAAIIGRLRNIATAITGALAIAIGQAMALGYLPGSGWLSQVQLVIPMAVLFIVLILLPQDRLRTASFSGAVAPRVASLSSSLVTGAVVIVASYFISGGLSGSNLRIGANAFSFALVLLSLVLVTGYGGMVSLCQMSFVGLGAYAMGRIGGDSGSLLGVLAAIGLAGGVGALIALPTLRLRGLYLALATFAFAAVMELAVFTQILGTGGAQAVARVHIPGISTQSDRGFFMLCVVVFVICAVLVLAVRRGPFGRKLVATNDSPAACATLGVNVNFTKLITFTAAAAIAGLAGALFGGSPGLVTTNDFASLLSLVILLLARIGGITTATGALFGAMVYALYPLLTQHVPQLGTAQYLLTGLGAISVGLFPYGMGGRIGQLADAWRAANARRGAPGTAAGTPAAVFIAEEGDQLVGAGS